MSERERLTEIDALKVAGLLTIVWIHAMRPPWDPDVSELEIWLGHLTRFGVPAFLFASGFLYASDGPSPRGTVAKRLRRILLPYALATLLAHAFGITHHTTHTPDVLLEDLLLGAALGPFYYVFVITSLVLVSPLFERLPRPALWALLGLSLAAQLSADVFILWLNELRWHIRNPAMWWSYYLAGWCLWLQRDAIRDFAARARVPLLLGTTLAAIACAVIANGDEEAHRTWVRAGAWLGTWVILAGVWLVGVKRESPGWLAWISDVTYTVFLYHLFFVLPLRDMLPLPLGALTWVPAVIPWLVGLAAPVLLVLLARTVLGTRSRLVLGA